MKQSLSLDRQSLLSHALMETLEDRRMLSAPDAVVAAMTSMPPAAGNASLRPPAAPSGLTVRSPLAKSVVLSWKDNSRNETAFRVLRKASSARQWHLVDEIPAQQTQYKVRDLDPLTTYQFRVRAINRAGASNYSNAVRATTRSQAPTSASEIVYSDPIVITHGGVYTGNWQSRDANVPAIRIATDEPVIIENSHIRSAGNLIQTSGYAADIIVRNSIGYALNPNVRGRFPGRFLRAHGFKNIRVINNYMEGTSGIYLDVYRGDHTAQESVKVLRNSARNIDGRFSNGRGGFMTGPDDNFYVQFFQINSVYRLAGAEIAWNQVINEPGKSRVEDNISIHRTTGTPQSPILIHNNYIEGAYPVNPTEYYYSGGGIMLSDNGSSWVRAYRNQVINTSNYGIAISSGHDNVFYENRIISSGRLPNGATVSSQNVGAYIWNHHGAGDFARNRGFNNYIGWVRRWSGRNDAWVPDASAWDGNDSAPGEITAADEMEEWRLWQRKLDSSGVQIGPVGDSI